MKVSKTIIFILIIAALGAGIYFKDDAIKFYNSFNKGAQSLKKTDIGSTLKQVEKEILTPPPLNIGGEAKPVVLLQSKIIAQTNLQRQENGNLPALKENTKLDEAALAKANDMFSKQYFEHVSPSGVDPGKLVQSFGYDYIVEGENLILGNFSSEKEVVDDWMASPGHRANILNNRYTEIGVAIIKGTYKGQTAWIGVQEFGFPLASCVQPNINLKNGIDSAESQLDIFSSEINDKKTQVDNTNQNSPAYGRMVDDYNKLVTQYNLLIGQIKEAVAEYNAQVNIFNNCVAGK